MKTETIWFLIAFGVQIATCASHCYGIYKYNRKWKEEYLRGFDEGCKWYTDELNKMLKK